MFPVLANFSQDVFVVRVAAACHSSYRARTKDSCGYLAQRPVGPRRGPALFLQAERSKELRQGKPSPGIYRGRRRGVVRATSDKRAQLDPPTESSFSQAKQTAIPVSHSEVVRGDVQITGEGRCLLLVLNRS